MISQGIFFHFFKILIFWAVKGGQKRKKWSKMTKNSICCTLLSQESYISGIIPWLSAMVHMCKMKIPLGITFIFLKFWFWGLLVGLKGNKWLKMTNFCPSCPISQEPYSMWLLFVIHICKMTRFPSIFHFLKILIF